MLTKFAIVALLGSLVSATERRGRRSGPRKPERPGNRNTQQDFELDMGSSDSFFGGLSISSYDRHLNRYEGDEEAASDDQTAVSEFAEDPITQQVESDFENKISLETNHDLHDIGLAEQIAAQNADFEEVKEGWFSSTEQYSPPYVMYYPYDHQKKEIHTVCEWQRETGDTFSGEVKFYQAPGSPMTVKVQLAGGQADTEYRVVFNRLGAIDNMCVNVGDEYNPLTEENHYGQLNPHQDPARGRIGNVSTNSSGAIDVLQEHILQNLSGPESIVGRSLSLYQVVADAEDMRVSCCVIARDSSPSEDIAAAYAAYEAYDSQATTAAPNQAAPVTPAYSAGAQWTPPASAPASPLASPPASPFGQVGQFGFAQQTTHGFGNQVHGQGGQSFGYGAQTHGFGGQTHGFYNQYETPQNSRRSGSSSRSSRGRPSHYDSGYSSQRSQSGRPF